MNQEPIVISRIEFFEDKDGAELYLTGKPTSEILDILRREGWRWYPMRKCWWRYNASQHLQPLRDAFRKDYTMTTNREA